MPVSPRPARYLEIAAELRKKVHLGTYPVGQALPSTAFLMNEYEVSSTVVQRAVRELKYEGILVGQAGKAVYVQQAPEADQVSDLDTAEIAKIVADLRDTFAETSRRLDDRLTALEQRVEQLQSKQ